jgi:hypothetical protein
MGCQRPFGQRDVVAFHHVVSVDGELAAAVKVGRDGNIQQETRYYVSSASLDMGKRPAWLSITYKVRPR